MPSHIRPENEIYFRQLPLAHMSFRVRWWLGAKILAAGFVIWLPLNLFFGFYDTIERHAPSFAASPVWSCIALVLLFAVPVLLPLWAAGLFRGWVASSAAQRLVEQTLAAPTSPNAQ